MATATSRKNAPSQKAAAAPAAAPGVDVVRTQPAAGKAKSYASEGVADNDVFLLPAADYQIMAVLTVIAAVVRLFRIYQPTSVVFDEVQ
jgi:dolichyl-phosphate-mannose-protein mannosyltransferase